MPCDTFTLSETTSRSVWWMAWRQVWPSGKRHWFERRTTWSGAQRFCKRHGLPVPVLPDRGRKR